MEFKPETYREAAFERLNAAFTLHGSGHYVEAYYLAGAAVECMFRAYHGRTGLPFDERHDLKNLAKSSGFVQAVPVQELERVSDCLSLTVAHWRNNLRYYRLIDLRSFLKNAKMDGGIRGNFVKTGSSRLLSAAAVLVRVGNEQWTPKTRNSQTGQ